MNFIKFFFTEFFQKLTEKEICGLKGAFVLDITNHKYLFKDILYNYTNLPYITTHDKFLKCSNSKNLKEKKFDYKFNCNSTKFCYQFNVKNLKFYEFSNENKKFLYLKFESASTLDPKHWIQWSKKKRLQSKGNFDEKRFSSLELCNKKTRIKKYDYLVKYYAEDKEFVKDDHIEIASLTDISLANYIEEKKDYTDCNEPQDLGNEIFINSSYLNKIEKLWNEEEEEGQEEIEQHKEGLEPEPEPEPKQQIDKGGKSKNYSKKIRKKIKKKTKKTKKKQKRQKKTKKRQKKNKKEYNKNY